MKNFVNCKECLTVAAYQLLDPGIKLLNPVHNCCSYCNSTKCERISCKASGNVLTFESDGGK